jgi:hypothetical protein
MAVSPLRKPVTWKYQNPIDGRFHDLDQRWQWESSQIGSTTTPPPIQARHDATGVYTIRFPGLASGTAIAHVSTFYNVWYRGPVCGADGLGAPGGSDEWVTVRCYDATGQPIDWRFTVYLGEPTAGTSPMAALWYDGDPASSRMPLQNARTYDSTGGLVNVVHLGTGTYRATIAGSAFAGDDGFAQLTTTGSYAAACQVNGTAPTAQADGLMVTIECHAIGAATPQPKDSTWALTYVVQRPLHNDNRVPIGAYMQTAGSPSAPVLDGVHSYNSTGQSIVVIRTGVGQYLVSLVGVASGRVEHESILVAALGANPGNCVDTEWNSNIAGPPEHRVNVTVNCFDARGNLGDSAFTVAYIRDP